MRIKFKAAPGGKRPRVEDHPPFENRGDPEWGTKFLFHYKLGHISLSTSNELSKLFPRANKDNCCIAVGELSRKVGASIY